MYHIAMTSFHPVLFTCSLSEIFSEPPLVVSEHLKMKVCVFVKAGGTLFLDGHNCAG